MRTLLDVLHYGKGGGTRNRLASGERLGQSDFATEFHENSPRGDAKDQTHHFAADFSLGINGRPLSEWTAETADRSGGEPDRWLRGCFRRTLRHFNPPDACGDMADNAQNLANEALFNLSIWAGSA